MSGQEKNCRVCGSTLKKTRSGALVCSSEACVTNKKTKPVCRACNVVMEEAADLPPGLFRCPVCKVVTGS